MQCSGTRKSSIQRHTCTRVFSTLGQNLGDLVVCACHQVEQRFPQFPYSFLHGTSKPLQVFVSVAMSYAPKCIINPPNFACFEQPAFLTAMNTRSFRPTHAQASISDSIMYKCHIPTIGLETKTSPMSTIILELRIEAIFGTLGHKFNPQTHAKGHQADPSCMSMHKSTLGNISNGSTVPRA